MNYKDICPSPFKPELCSDDFIAEYCKAWRNRQLAASDWTQLSDINLSNKQEWIIYRQALRDLPAQNPDPKLWVLPEAPQ
jgi:hypothetical protein